MTGPYPSIDEPGILQDVQREFVRTLKKPRAGFALFANKETRVSHWGIQELKWREVSEMSDAVVSLDIPPVQADSGTVTTRTVEIPVFTKDLHYSGRSWRRIVESGLDPVAIQEAGHAMSEEINRALLLGFGSGNPGPDTGLLNDANINTVTGGDWSDPDVVNTDLAKAMKENRKDRHYGPYSLVINPDDSEVFDAFIASTDRRIGDRLPMGVSRILYDDLVTATEAYVVDDRTVGNFDVVLPRNEDNLRFGLSTAASGFVNQNAIDPAGTRMTKFDELMLERTIRFLNILTPRVIRSESVCKVDFTKS